MELLHCCLLQLLILLFVLSCRSAFHYMISTVWTMVEPQANHYCNTLQERLCIIVTAKMQGVFRVTPYPWQDEAIVPMALMNVSRGRVSCAPILLVRPTGGGKSLVRDVYSILNAIVCLTITLLLLVLGCRSSTEDWV
jgi:hypothetical protein